jgi:tetratricopeptide (TPR) repeat protein
MPRTAVGRCIEFGDFKLYPEKGQLHKFGVRLKQARPQHVAFLTILAERLGERVSKDEIRSLLWPGQHLAKNRLNVIASELWTILGDTDREHRRYFVSLGRQSYCFIHPTKLTTRSAPAPNQLRAEEAFRAARRCLEDRQENSLRKAIVCLKRAIDFSPSNSEMWVALGEAKVLLGLHCGEAPEEAFSKARAAAQEALRIAPSCAEALVTLGWVELCYGRNGITAYRYFQKALRRRPDYPFLHNALALLNIAAGKVNEAVACLQKAHRLAPISGPLTCLLSNAMYLARRFDDAIDSGRRAIASDPDSCMAHSCLGQALLQTGEEQEALNHFAQARKLSANSKVYTGYWAHACARTGFASEAHEGLNMLLSRSRHEYAPSYFLGLIQLGLGNIPEGLEWLQKACEERAHWVLFLNTEPVFDDLRRNATFRQLLAQSALKFG